MCNIHVLIIIKEYIYYVVTHNTCTYLFFLILYITCCKQNKIGIYKSLRYAYEYINHTSKLNYKYSKLYNISTYINCIIIHIHYYFYDGIVTHNTFFFFK